MTKFIHLHVHTQYSLVDGLLRINDYIGTLARMGLPASAVTELYNVFSMVKFYQECLRQGIKPIIGAEISLADDNGDNDKDNRLVLLCRDNDGFKNLTTLITRSFIDGQVHGAPVVFRHWLEDHSGGLIALSGARNGEIGQSVINGNHDLARTQVAWFQELFPDRFYLELQRTNRQGEDIYIDGALALAAEFDAPVVATNDVRFLSQDDFEAHEARVCIQTGYTLNDSRRPRLYSREQYLKTPEQMVQLFHDIPEAIENTGAIAKRCNLELQFGEYHLPEFPVPAGFNQGSWLRKEAETGLQGMAEDKIASGSAIEVDEYKKRLNLELDVIINMGFPGYFLIVADFIHWARRQGIPVGPGRGSGAGSLVAYVLGITDLDPIDHKLLFERFLNPERVSLPDFDVDFCMDRRDEVIEYVAHRYGRDHVSQIITFGSMAAKAVVRDVGRVLGHPYGYVDKIAKSIPFDLNMTLDKALSQEEALKQRYDDEDEVKMLIDLAKKLEGLARNAGKHAGGIVIAPRPLTEFMPLYCEKGTAVTSTQFDMGDVETMGLVKFDFLGLRTLTIIDWAVKDINELSLDADAEKLDISNIPLDDKDTYQLVQRMDTTAVFQLESEGIRKLIKRLVPDKFDDLIALVALFRPGPLQSGMVDDFIDRRHGRARVEYPHAALEKILKPTYGVILYQEQVMQIAQLLGGYTLGAADLLRRAMGKKKPEEMSLQRNIFVSGAVKNNVDKKVAVSIFNLMEHFAGYGFNKSHSVAYALLAYQTAWLKTHYPAAFMAAVFSADMRNTDKVVELREELRRMKLTLRPPSLNNGEYKFKVVDEKTILYGLGAIKGVGKSAAISLSREREERGKFSDLFQFCQRVDTRRINKGVIEALIRSGAMDDFGQGRSVLTASLEKALRFAEQYADNTDTGQDDLFGLEMSTQPVNNEAGWEIPYVMTDDWEEEERLQGEKETLGFYLEGHPITRYEKELACFISTRLSDVKPGLNLTVAGYIESIKTRSGIRGRMAEIRLDDRTARVHMTVYSENYHRYRNVLLKDQLVIVKGEAVADDYYEAGVSIVAKDVYTLAQLRAHFGILQLNIHKNMMDNGLIAGLKEILSRHQPGANPVSTGYNNGHASATLKFGDSWTVKISDELIADLTGMVGADNVSLEFPGRINL